MQSMQAIQFLAACSACFIFGLVVAAIFKGESVREAEDAASFYRSLMNRAEDVFHALEQEQYKFSEAQWKQILAMRRLLHPKSNVVQFRGKRVS